MLVWEDAGATQVSGVAVERLDVKTGRAVLRYGVNSREALFALPLDADGRPPQPFLYRGSKRTPQEILHEVSQSQERDIVDRRLAYLSMRDERREDWERHGGAEGGWVWTMPYTPCGRRGLAVVAAAPAGQGLEAVRGDPDGHGVVFPRGCVVMLLPPEQPRPAADLAWARVQAVLLTPVEVAADVAVLPLAELLIFLGVPRC